MDFTLYAKGLVLQYKDEGLDQYYVNPLFDKNKDLEEYIFDWLGNKSSKPIAILAGYGMGKTSFARHIAHKMAREKSKIYRRIPILIRLGEIATEQDLEGLISKVLAADSNVKNYHFNLFMELNRRGKFFIILDGFDEMKHTMSWSQFKYNFSQLNRLIVPNSKVLLLGRPSAFLSDAEYYLVLKGLTKYKGKEILEPGWPKYEEITLEFFDTKKSHEFIIKYINYLEKINASIEGRDVDAEFLTNRIEEIQSPLYHDLISRPVQAKMLTEIAVDPAVGLKAYSRYELYEIFITRIIEREQKKLSRKNFTSRQRHDFIKDVAWWLWTKSGMSGFNSEVLPSDILQAYCNEDVEVDSIKRDLLSGSILETKAAENFYFPHRSFQEFLVAEYVMGREWDTDDIKKVSKNLNPEVAKFIQESGHIEPLLNWFELLSAAKGELSFTMLSLIAWGLSKSRMQIGDRANRNDNPWYVLIKFLYFFERDDIKPEVAANYVIQSFDNLDSTHSKLMSLVCMYLLFGSASQGLTDKLSSYFCALILKEALPSLEEVLRINSSKKKDSKNIVVPAGVDNIFMDMVIEGFLSVGNENKVKIITTPVFNVLHYYLQPYWIVENIDESIPSNTFVIDIESLANISNTFKVSSKGPVVAKFFREIKNPQELIRVQKKSRRSLH